MRRPNILWICSDQHNPHVAGYAGHPVCRTPTLDRLAAGGVRFSAAYCQSPLCVPSRISMMTGRPAHACGAFDNLSVLDPALPTIAGLLGDAGYATAAIGKMHLRGPAWRGGFQHRPYGDLLPSLPFHQPDPPRTVHASQWASHRVGRFPFAGPSAIPESMLLDNVLPREAAAWVLEQHARDPRQPWLAFVGFGRPHFPLTVPRRYFDSARARVTRLPARPEGYPHSLHPHDRHIVEDFHLTEHDDEVQRRGLAAYVACVEYVDEQIGTLLDALERAGAMKDIVIVYVSDHGDMAGEHGLWWKRTYYEASAGVPMLLHGAGAIPGGLRG